MLVFKIILLFWCTNLLASDGSEVSYDTTVRVQKEAENSTFIMVRDENLCSGFVVGSYAVTNHHCIRSQAECLSSKIYVNGHKVNRCHKLVATNSFYDVSIFELKNQVKNNWKINWSEEKHTYLWNLAKDEEKFSLFVSHRKTVPWVLRNCVHAPSELIQVISLRDTDGQAKSAHMDRLKACNNKTVTEPGDSGSLVFSIHGEEVIVEGLVFASKDAWSLWVPFSAMNDDITKFLHERGV